MSKLKLLKLANKIGLGAPISRYVINDYATCTPARPRPFSMWSHVPPNTPEEPLRPDDPAEPKHAGYVSDYTSWPSLVDRGFSSRHLPPAKADYAQRLPQDATAVAKLFSRSGPMLPSRSSALFAFFAQWFTDSILRFDSYDRRRNTSNHDIDLCQIYGLNANATNALRAPGGLLASRDVGGEEMLDLLCEPDGADWRVRARYRPAPGALVRSERDWPLGYGDGTLKVILGDTFAARKSHFYATGLERGNSSIGYAAISTIFMREHNRLGRELKRRYAFDDERVFQTARMINIVILLKLVVEDYINHILGGKLFRLEPGFGEDKSWYRPNWIAAEFDLLYRWHGLMPDTIAVGATQLRPDEYRNNNALIENAGLAAIIDAASRAPAGRIGLFNSPEFLWQAELRAVQMGRAFRLQPYNAYRKRFGLRRLESFAELCDDTKERSALQELYQNIDDVEYVVGVFAERREGAALFGELLTHMVAYDAFTQIFTNPLLAKEVYGPATFTEWGLEQIEQTESIQDLVDRNLRPGMQARARLGL